MNLHLLNDILIVLGLSIVALFLCNRLRVPTIVGFLLTGILVGPHGLSLIMGIQEVGVFAEIGVVLLLFTLGIEFSLKNLIQIGRTALLGGSLQVFLTIVVVSAVATYSGLSLRESIFVGFLISLSSTAIVLKLLQDRAEVDTPHGRMIIGILIYQDIIIVPMMLFSPLLAGTGERPMDALLLIALKGTAVIVLVFAFAKWVLPRMLYQIARTRSRELFVLSVVVICLSIAWLTHGAGLSYALGAFLAGLMISNSEYGHEALGNILPFKDVFTSFFFVSIGMLLSVSFLISHPFLILTLVCAVIFIKAIIAGLSTTLLGFPARVSIVVALSICQVGEFSFVLSKTGIEYGLITGEHYQIFLTLSILTMILTPFLVVLSPRAADTLIKVPMPKAVRDGFPSLAGVSEEVKKVPLNDHLVIIGFGLNGRNVARSAKAKGIPYVIVEMNPETVRTEKEKGQPIFYGDATRQPVLEYAGIRKAKVMVCVIHDAAATRGIVTLARRLNKTLHVIARTHFIQEMIPLYELGANEVIPEEFETSVEIFARVLTQFNIPRSEIESFIGVVRADGYKMFRSLSKENIPIVDSIGFIPDNEVETYRVANGSPIVGKTLGEIDLRKKYGVTLLTIRRKDQTLSHPDGEVVINAHDILILLGSPTALSHLSRTLLSPGKQGA